jgi:hypothetical protein
VTVLSPPRILHLLFKKRLSALVGSYLSAELEKRLSSTELDTTNPLRHCYWLYHKLLGGVGATTNGLGISGGVVLRSGLCPFLFHLIIHIRSGLPAAQISILLS